MIPLCSKRNQVYASVRENWPVVEKHFSQIDDWAREVELYGVLAGAVPLLTVVYAEPRLLITEYVSCPTLLAELERQEVMGFSPAPWRALLEWLELCWNVCGCLPDDGNLRNFLWDSGNARVIGLDLECFQAYPSLEDYLPRLLTSILRYDPAGTPLKVELATWLQREARLPDSVFRVVKAGVFDRQCRENAASPFSGIVLAGGRSKRMGQNKAALPLLGKPMVQWQADKLRALGADEILLSGSDCPHLPGTRVIPDIYLGRGPLGGLHACLDAAKHTRCMVLSVDVPLVPVSALYQLSRSHRGSVTVLRHPGGIEPLIGVYDKSINTHIEPLIRSGGAPVSALCNIVPWRFWDYSGPLDLLKNCNTPEEYLSVVALAEQYAAFSLPI